MSTTTQKPLIREQVVTVTVTGDLRDLRSISSENFLQEHMFTIKTAVDTSKKITGIAPNDGDNCFVLIEYANAPRLTNIPFTIYLIYRGKKTIIDTGRIHFRFGADTYTCAGDTVPTWEIVTEPASAEILARTALFANDKLTIKDSAFMPPDSPPLLAGANLISFAGRKDPILRIKDRSPAFAKLVDTEGNGDYSITAVSAMVVAHLNANRNLSTASMARIYGERNDTVFQQLVAISELHPNLKQHLNVSPDEEIKGKARLSLSVAAQIAKIPLDMQPRAWEEIKKCATHEKKFRDIKKIREKIREHGTF
ncbi:MAG: hypothetical protein V4524_03575 [Patescibacteria group bacterium]